MRMPKYDLDSPVFHLKVTLLEVEPCIWRRFLIRQDVTLYKLNDYLEGVMGWKGYHHHDFKIHDKSYGVPSPIYDDLEGFKMHNERRYKLCHLVEVGDVFEWEYDFGDCWQHIIEVEKVFEREAGGEYPVCVEGERACPPEDVGGSMGYEEFLKVISDPSHEEYEHLVEWSGGDFDPEKCNLEFINLVLSSIKSRSRDPG